MTSTLTLTTPTDREIVLRRSFAAPRHLVFAAFTRPGLLRRWYGARGWRLVECEVDLRVSGGYRFGSVGPGGERMTQRGVYRVVDPPSTLAYTERFDDQSYSGETLITHSFREGSEAPPATPAATTATTTTATTTTVTTTVRYPSARAREIALRYPMRRGVAESYQRLDGLLAGLPERNGGRER